MINKKSVATAYDEHLTLVEWLQEVKNALDNAVLTGITMEQVEVTDNTATYQIVARFADDTEVTSDPFDLPSPRITEAFNDLANLVTTFDGRITANKNNVASILDIIDIGNDKINTSTLHNSINGSDDVIVDVDETNDKLDIHLSAELQAKLARVLLKPSSAPSTRKVVTIDTNGAQDNVDSTELPTLMTNIVDSHENPRFVEGNMSTPTNKNITLDYGKWSLSGTHLMIVASITIAPNTSLNYVNICATLNIPSYILNKVVTIVPNSNKVDFKNFRSFVGTSPSDSFTFNLGKTPTNLIIEGYSLTAGETERIIRIQFDLLIDNE